ncbi:uncharacterized protein AB675_11848 [Cyphellophora attinorum]|uniref:NAD(P)-binding protein n=1 Tax=Cyphellophora attinorum TaxID=1664694 RepID=A0A0N1NZ09_9EURO|nr:uncharacterized protein AB675_11848 [Phialophora attinorum]KPI36883.1 hypothetical protein AB675_11848 [Phialophora attinorum]
MAIRPIPTLNGDAALKDAVWNKVTLVTGAASGIGFALTRMLASHGATVIMVDRDSNALTAAQKNIPGRAFAYECDIAAWEQQRHLFQVVLDRFMRLDIVCLNAAIDPELRCDDPQLGAAAADQVAYNWLANEKTSAMTETTDRSSIGQEAIGQPSWMQASPYSQSPPKQTLKAPPTQIFDVNLLGTIYGIKLALHHMTALDAHALHSGTLAQPNPRHIIVTGSAAAYNGFPGQDLYCASKHALLGLVRATSRRKEVQEAGVSVSMVCPWLTTTPMTAGIAAGLKEGLPASEPDDVVQAFVQLLVGAGQGSNGRLLSVQGQRVMEVERID